MHGGCCEQRPYVTTSEQNPTTLARGEPHDQKFDMSFPVVVEDGRRLTIEWNSADEPQKVAQSFALDHGIAADELSSILAFVQKANAMCGENRKTQDDQEMKNASEQFGKFDVGVADPDMKHQDADSNKDQIEKPALDCVTFDYTEQPSEEVEQPNEELELACATPALAGTAPAGMMMATAPAMEEDTRSRSRDDAPFEPSAPVAIGVAIGPDGWPLISPSMQLSDACDLRGLASGYPVGHEPSAPASEEHFARQTNVVGLISPDARIDQGAQVGAGAVIEAGARLHGGCDVQAHARIGSGSEVHGGARVCQHAVLGSNCKLHGGSVVGVRAYIGSGTEIHGGTNVSASATVGENCTIHGGASICESAHVGGYTTVHGGACVGSNAVVEEQCTLHGGSYVHANARLARSTTLHAGSSCRS